MKSLEKDSSCKTNLCLYAPSKIVTRRIETFYFEDKFHFVHDKNYRKTYIKTKIFCENMYHSDNTFLNY